MERPEIGMQALYHRYSGAYNSIQAYPAIITHFSMNFDSNKDAFSVTLFVMSPGGSYVILNARYSEQLEDNTWRYAKTQERVMPTKNDSILANEMKLRGENYDLQDRIYKLEQELAGYRGGGRKGSDGLQCFIRRDMKDHDTTIGIINHGCSPVIDASMVIVVEWTEQARNSGIVAGTHGQLDLHHWYSLPRELMAESWWHVCAQTGLHEGFARLLYKHPETAGASAVAKAVGKPSKELKVYCQGEED